MLGVFVEGTRQKSGVPGEVQPGAAMVALQEGVPVVCGAIHGTQDWKLGNFAPASVAWSEPMRFEGFPRGAKGYRPGLGGDRQGDPPPLGVARDIHAAGRPRNAVPPRLNR